MKPKLKSSPLPAEGAVALLLCASVLLVFGQVTGFGFLFFDDDLYILDNPRVRSGLTREGLAWAFSTPLSGHYHPLTWLSHMLDVELFGLNPSGHHLTSLLLHLANTLLLCLWLRLATGRRWESAWVSAVFALHPLHVEAVAWVADRKDLLAGFFFLLGLVCYTLYARRPGPLRYAGVAACLVLGLLSKSVLAAMPLILLLLDVWPLNRLAGAQRPRRPIFLLAEKVPFFLVSLLFVGIALWAFEAGKKIAPESLLAADTRPENLLAALALPAWKALWPAGLAPVYPPGSGPPLWQSLPAAVFLLSATGAALLAYRRFPPAFTGWFWYLASLAPLAGLLKHGPFRMADRYTYLPLVGLLILAAWSASAWSRKAGRRRKLIGAAAAGSLLVFAVLSFFQAAPWRDTIRLFQHAVSVTEDNYVAHNNLGVALSRAGRNPEAISHLETALRIHPEYLNAYNNLGVVYAQEGDLEAAIRHFREALRIRPDYPFAERNLARALEKQKGRREDPPAPE